MPTVTTPHPHWAVTPPAVRRSVPLATTLVDGAYERVPFTGRAMVADHNAGPPTALARLQLSATRLAKAEIVVADPHRLRT